MTNGISYSVMKLVAFSGLYNYKGFVVVFLVFINSKQNNFFLKIKDHLMFKVIPGLDMIF